METRKPERLELTAILRREDDQWTALCLELDIAAYGDTDEDAFASLRELVDQYVKHMRARGKTSDEIYRPVPTNALAEFLGAKEEEGAQAEPASQPRIVKREVETARFVYA